MLYLLLPAVGIKAQEAAISKDGRLIPIQTNFSGNTITLLKSQDVQGTPMLSDRWSTGAVKFRDGREIDSLQLQFNLETNKLLFRSQGLTLEFIDTVTESSFEYVENEQKRKVLLKNGYPETDGHNTSSFYIVLVDGKKFQLLQYKGKKAISQYSYNTSSSVAYKEWDDLFIYENSTNAMHKIKEKKASVLNALPGSGAIIKDICSQNKLELNSITEVAALISLMNK